MLLAASMDQAVSVLDGRPPIDLLFTEINMRRDVHGGLVLAQRAVELRPLLPVRRVRCGGNGLRRADA